MKRIPTAGASSRGPRGASTFLDTLISAALAIFAVSSVIVPLCLPEIRDEYRLGIQEGGLFETVRTGAVILILFLVSFTAHRVNRKGMLTAGLFLIAAGLFLISLASGYKVVILGIFGIGLGGGLVEALSNPVVADNHHGDSGRYLNITNAFYSLAVVAASLLFGELLTRGLPWRRIFQSAALLSALVGVLLPTAPFPAGDRVQGGAFRSVLITLCKQPEFRILAVLILLGGGAEAAFIFWGRSYVDLYLSRIPRIGTLSVLIFAGAMAGGRLAAGSLIPYLGGRFVMLLSALLGAAAGLLLSTPLVSTPAGFMAVMAAAGLATACFWPTVLAEAVGLFPREATRVCVLLAGAGILGYGSVPFVIGVAAERYGLKAGFVVIPVLFTVLAGLLWRLALIRRGRSSRGA